MPSYPFMTYSGLLEPKHYKRIGSAIWLFLWCISSTTKEIEKDGITWGIVLGNKPMRLSELAEIFGVNEKTIRRWLEALEQHEYIRITRAPYGLILSVKNSKKFKERVDKNVQSERDRTKMSEPERTNVSNHSDKNVHSNKDITEDIINITDDNKDPIDFIADRFKDLKTIQAGKPSYPTAKDYEAIAQIVVLGVPLPITIKLLEQCFEDFKRNNPKKTITSIYYDSPNTPPGLCLMRSSFANRISTMLRSSISLEIDLAILSKGTPSIHMLMILLIVPISHSI